GGRGFESRRLRQFRNEKEPDHPALFHFHYQAFYCLGGLFTLNQGDHLPKPQERRCGHRCPQAATCTQWTPAVHLPSNPSLSSRANCRSFAARNARCSHKLARSLHSPSSMNSVGNVGTSCRGHSVRSSAKGLRSRLAG